jgi:hypothetical protein
MVKGLHASILPGIESAMRERVMTDANGRKYITTDPFKPDYNTEAVLVEEMQRVTKITWDERGVRTVNGVPDDAPPLPVQELGYWHVIDSAGNIVASETNAIRGWARIAGSYKPTVEGLLGFHDQGWRVVPAPPPPVQERNFCPRCGKRTADLTTIHTCTPPQEKNT